MLVVEGLSFDRGSHRLLDGVGFTLAAGGCLHLQGTNGSGKTTLLRLIAGLTQPDTGRITWDGCAIAEPESRYRHDCLYIGHANGLQESATVAENMAFHCALTQQPFQRSHLMHVLCEHGLLDTIDRPIKALSQGQKRRVAMLRLNFSRARLWLLDEPLVALDQTALHRFSQLLTTHLANRGLAIITSHQALDTLFQTTTLVLG